MVEIKDKASKITDELKKDIESVNTEPKIEEIGTVIEVKDGIVKLEGLDKCKSQEMLQFPNGVRGLALNLEEHTVGAILLDDFTKTKSGDTVRRTHKIMSIPVGYDMIGRVLNSLGKPIDGLGEIQTEKESRIEKIAPGVMTREPVGKPLQTGIKAIDALIPIGRGQRELIIGDRQTGKTAIAIDTILNQSDQNIKCIYVAIGQKESKVARIVNILKEKGAMEYTTVFSASASDPAPMLYLAPYSGVTLAEFFASNGEDVLIIYDDLSKQASAYREMSLLLRRPPGREAYPGDVFYLHSRLLERACNLNEKHGGGSITALPIIETQAGDISAYVPTNVISITDGQIFLESNLFYKGQRPAVNVGLSVSRVGSSAQIKPMKNVAGKMKLEHAQFRELEAFAQFSSDLDSDTKKRIERGKRVNEILKQLQYRPLNVAEQIVSIYALNNGFFDDIEINKIFQIENKLIQFMNNLYKELLEKLSNGNWEDKTVKELDNAIKAFDKEGNYNDHSSSLIN